MADPLVRVIKFDVGSATDVALGRMQAKLSAPTASEAMRRSVTIADKITDFIEDGREVFVKDQNGTLQRIVIS